MHSSCIAQHASEQLTKTDRKTINVVSLGHKLRILFSPPCSGTSDASPHPSAEVEFGAF